jgi:hypothetical protein
LQTPSNAEDSSAMRTAYRGDRREGSRVPGSSQLLWPIPFRFMTMTGIYRLSK